MADASACLRRAAASFPQSAERCCNTDALLRSQQEEEWPEQAALCNLRGAFFVQLTQLGVYVLTQAEPALMQDQFAPWRADRGSGSVDCWGRSARLAELAAGPRPVHQPDAARPPRAGAPVEGHLQLHLVLLRQLPHPLLQLPVGVKPRVRIMVVGTGMEAGPRSRQRHAQGGRLGVQRHNVNREHMQTRWMSIYAALRCRPAVCKAPASTSHP